MTKHPNKLKEECRQEAYDYYHENIEPLPKKEDGSFDESSGEMSNNEADAFRHAYTSGVFSKEYYSKTIADFLGQGNEIKNPNPENQRNMDLWNNNVGRKYSKKSKNRQELAELLKIALKNGELIISLDDPRKYDGPKPLINLERSVIMIKQKASGLNEMFYDFIKEKMMSLDEFIEEIEKGNYQGYQIIENNGTEYVRSKPDKVISNNLG